MSDEIEQAFREGLTTALLPPSIKKLADYYGFTSQADMLVEESAEFTQAVNKLRRGHAEAYSNIKEELADTLVIALQLRYLLGADDIDKIMRAKIDRQLKRIEEEGNEED